MGIKITKIHIQNFRSILKLEIGVEQKNGLIVFCGANNVGKTNVLKAMALFFNKNIFQPYIDCPSHKYYGTRGASYRPKIEICFIDEDNNSFCITKNWNLQSGDEKDDTYEDDGAYGYKMYGTKNKNKLSKIEIKTFLNNIHFFFLEAINISFPQTIQMLFENVFELETAKKRISGSRKELKSKIEKVLQELKIILDELASNISPLLEKYGEGWGLGFDVPQTVESFRDLLIAKTDFYIQDKSNGKILDSKGSGLQRLSHILMHFRILRKFIDDNKNWIMAIDEPDVYLHAGLQKKLFADMKEYGKNGQFFITTHSPIFINCNTFENVNLLEQQVETKKYIRTGDRQHSCLSTALVDINNGTGIKKIKSYLGIEEEDFLFFDGLNLVVEGECDKTYLNTLLDIYGIEKPTIFSCGGADSIISFLGYCEIFASDNAFFRIILDNDEKGREQFARIQNKNFRKIKKEILFIDGSLQVDGKKDNKKNIEIEDLIPIEIMCENLNQILKRINLATFTKRDIRKIKHDMNQPVFKNNGILKFLENRKNEKNPIRGLDISVEATRIKGALADQFKRIDREQRLLILSDRELFDFMQKIAQKS